LDFNVPNQNVSFSNIKVPTHNASNFDVKVLDVPFEKYGTYSIYKFF